MSKIMRQLLDEARAARAEAAGGGKKPPVDLGVAVQDEPIPHDSYCVHGIWMGSTCFGCGRWNTITLDGDGDPV